MLSYWRIIFTSCANHAEKIIAISIGRKNVSDLGRELPADMGIFVSIVPLLCLTFLGDEHFCCECPLC